MIFQWYSGSDASGRIARRLNELLYHLRDRLPLDVLVRELEALATEEQDPNMRAKIFFEIGRLYGHAGELRAKDEYWDRALAALDLLAANFPSVAREYVEVNRSLASREVDASGRPRTLFDDAPHLLATIVWGDSGRLEEFDRLLAVAHIANFFRECADVFGHPVFAQLSLICASRRHHGEPDDSWGLLQLLNALGRLGDKRGVCRVLEMLKEVDLTGEYYQEAVRSWGSEKE